MTESVRDKVRWFGRSMAKPATRASLVFLATIVVIIVVIVAAYLNGRANRADHRTALQRDGNCAILDRIPVGVDSGIDKARKDYDCGPPSPPKVFLGRPQTKTVIERPRPTATVPATPAVTVEPRVTVTAHASPSHRHRRSATSGPHPSKSAHPKPAPSPSSSPCLLGLLCLGG